MAMPALALVNALVQLWVDPPESRRYTDTADAIEDLWIQSSVSIFSTATIFTPGITHAPMAVVGGEASPAEAAAAFESACSTMVLATTYTPSGSWIFTPPPIPVTATPGSLSSALLPIFADPESGTNAVTQALAIGGHIETYLKGWQIAAQLPPSAPTVLPII